MLNERQIKVVINKVNDDVNLPFISERREERMIERLVERIVPNVEPALQFLMPDVYVRCIKLALNEQLNIKERRDSISELVRGELAEPLSRELNERVDCSILPENLEGKVLKVVSNKVIDKFVEWTVGQVEDKFTYDEQDREVHETSAPSNETSAPSNILNERQTKVVIDKVNDDVNLPFVSERREERLIEKLIDRINPNMEPALDMLMPDVCVRCIKLALNERLQIKERRDRISELVRGVLSEPLSRKLNERVDCSIVPENLEGKMLKLITNKIIHEFVEWTVEEVEEKFTYDEEEG